MYSTYLKPLKQLVQRRTFTSSTSTICNTSSLVETTINESNTIATMTFKRPPVNSLSLEMCRDISSSLKELEAERKLNALVIKSSNSNVFSAGLDIMELSNPDKSRLDQFWNSLQECFMNLYGSKLATIAAIEGSAPAAGCMLAMACDYRIMTTETKHGIGLNETKLGIAAPYWMVDLMIRTIGHRNTEKSLALGTLYNCEEALEIGLVDEINDHVIERAYEVASIWSKIPSQARIQSKQLTRKKFIDDLKFNQEEDLNTFKTLILDPYVQKSLSIYLHSLSTKNKA